MKRSVLFVTPYFKPRLGGVETHVDEVSRELINKGWKVDVLTQHTGDKAPSDSNELTILPITVADSLKKQEIWQQVSQYKKRFQIYDVIHVHDVVWWMIPWLFSIRKKLFITYHGWEGKYPVRWQAKLQRWLLSLFAKGSIHVGDFIREFYWDTPTVVTYGGVSITKHPSFHAVSQKSLNIVFFGRLESENAIEEYLKVFQQLRRKGIALTVTWVGDGSFRSECQKLGKVTGMVTEPSKYLDAADVVCANSYLSILEAQAKGKIVCAIYQHELKRAYLEKYPGSKAMIIAGSATELRGKFSSLIEDADTFKKTSSSAFAFAQTQSWKKVAELYEKLWSTII